MEKRHYFTSLRRTASQRYGEGFPLSKHMEIKLHKTTMRGTGLTLSEDYFKSCCCFGNNVRRTKL